MKEIKSEASLTFGEATSILIGHGVGAGILSIPYLASRNSILDLVLVLAAAYGVNLLLHCMIAELSYHNDGAQFIKCFERELFAGPLRKVFTWLAFALLGFSVVVNVSGFLTGASAVFRSWFGLPGFAGTLIFYVIGGGVVFFGMKLVGFCEKIAVAAMVAVVGVLVAGTLAGSPQSIQGAFVSGKNVLALYSMIAFALSAVMSVPQVVKGLGGDVRRIRASIAAGTAINLLLIVVITLTTLAGAGREISQNGALVDLSEHLGGWVGVIGYLFTLLALATSFWANTLDLRDIVSEQTKWGLRPSWAAATLPSLVIALLGVTSFVGFTRLASVVQVLTGVGVIVAYHRSRRRAGSSPICGRFGTLPFQILVLAGSIAATAGAVLKIG